jgi:hypothetical protein
VFFMSRLIFTMVLWMDLNRLRKMENYNIEILSKKEELQINGGHQGDAYYIGKFFGKAAAYFLALYEETKK